MDSKNILVVGWYGNGKNIPNLGDYLFTVAFKHIFKEFNFTFTERIELEDVEKNDAIFFGGGSFLDNEINIHPAAREELIKKPIFYLNVGLDTSVSQDHLMLLSQAKLIVARNNPETDKIKGFPVLRCPDFVYALNNIVPTKPIEKSLLFLPNAFVMPQNTDLNWKFAAWNYFRSQVCETLDELIEDGWMVHFYPMCQNKTIDDSWAAVEILDLMKHRNKYMLLNKPLTEMKDIISLFSRNSIILTQRFHGIVLADLAQRPVVSISHHDKIQSDISISYYNTSKTILHNVIKSAKPSVVKNYNEKFNEIYNMVTNYLR